MKRMWEKVKETWREFWFVYEDEEDSTQHLSRSDKQSIWCGSFLMCAFTAVLCMAGIAIGNIRNNRQYEQDVEETLNMIATYFATATEDEYDEIAQTIRHDLVFSEYGRDMENLIQYIPNTSESCPPARKAIRHRHFLFVSIQEKPIPLTCITQTKARMMNTAVCACPLVMMKSAKRVFM